MCVVGWRRGTCANSSASSALQGHWSSWLLRERLLNQCVLTIHRKWASYDFQNSFTKCFDGKTTVSKTKQASAEKDCRTSRSRNILWSPIYILKLSSLEELQQNEPYPSSECCGACISTEGAVRNLRVTCYLLGTSWDFLFAILFVSIYLFVSAWAFLTVLSLGHGALKT